MCFIFSDTTERLIAKEDITCYKVMYGEQNNTVKSWYEYHIYEFGKLNKKIKIKPYASCAHNDETYAYDIDRGYHSYKTRAESIKWKAYLLHKLILLYNSKNQKPPKLSKPKVYKCTIPKGTKYYKNRDELVSLSIIFNKIVYNKIYTGEEL